MKLIYFLLFFSWTIHAEASIIHAIIVGDTNNYSIRESVIKDIANIHTLLIEVAQSTDMQLDTVLIEGDKTLRREVLNNISQMFVEPDDVIVAYFSQHGYRDPDQTSPWPNLLFSNEQKGLELENIIIRLIEKSPRLLVTLVDACNEVIPDIDSQIIPNIKLDVEKKIYKKRSQENYSSLFLKSSGVIIASASAPGELAWANPNKGGVMTTAFINSMDKISKSKLKPTWQKIIEEMELNIEAQLAEVSMQQTLLYEININ